MHKDDVMDRFHRMLTERVKGYDRPEKGSWLEQAVTAFWKFQHEQGEFALDYMRQEHLIRRETFWLAAYNFIEAYLIAKQQMLEGRDDKT